MFTRDGHTNKLFLATLLFLSLLFLAGACFKKTGSTGTLQEHMDTAHQKELLGRMLFYEKALSVNGTKACASCHDPRFAFSDNYRTSITALGESLRRNAPGLINSCFYQFYDWANDHITSYHQQIKRPLYSSHPIELGLNVNLSGNIASLQNNPAYNSFFRQLYPGEEQPVSPAAIEDAIIHFVRSLSSFNSPYDRFVTGNSTALSADARAGMQLFMSSKLQCSSCHRPPLFTTNAAALHLPADSIYFNTGLYNIAGTGHYPAADEGLYEHTGKASDRGKFKTPSLRNVALTAPYMHDGSVASLDEVIGIYSRGGRIIASGPLKGDGKDNPYKSERLKGIALNNTEKRQLIAFLYSLTDSSVLNNLNFLPMPRN